MNPEEIIDGQVSVPTTITTTITTITTTDTTITTTSANLIANPGEGPSFFNRNSANLYEQSAITIKLPQFWPQSPEVWFITAEAQFTLHGIKSESRKYTHLLTALPLDIIQSNIDIIQSPPNPTTLYSSFKEELIRRLIPNEETRIMELLYNSEIGDRRPSSFYRHLLQLVGRSTEIGNKVIRKVFLDRLPKPIQRTLITIEKFPMEEQLTIADKLWDSEKEHRFGINQITHQDPKISEIGKLDSSHTLSSDVSSLREEINTLKKLVEKCLTLGKGNNFHKKDKYNNKFTKYKEKSKSQESLLSTSDEGLCWYHRKFADKAAKCTKPCKHFGHSENYPLPKN